MKICLDYKITIEIRRSAGFITKICNYPKFKTQFVSYTGKKFVFRVYFIVKPITYFNLKRYICSHISVLTGRRTYIFLSLVGTHHLML